MAKKRKITKKTNIKKKVNKKKIVDKKIIKKRYKSMSIDKLGQTLNRVQLDKKEVEIYMEDPNEIPIFKNILRDAEIQYEVIGNEQDRCYKLIPRILTQEEELKELDEELDDFFN